MGKTINLLVDPVDVADGFLDEEEIEYTMSQECQNHTEGPLGMQADHLKICLTTEWTE